MAMIDVVLAANPKQLAEFKGGKVNLKSFFEGWVLWVVTCFYVLQYIHR